MDDAASSDKLEEVVKTAIGNAVRAAKAKSGQKTCDRQQKEIEALRAENDKLKRQLEEALSTKEELTVALAIYLAELSKYVDII